LTNQNFHIIALQGDWRQVNPLVIWSVGCGV